MIDIPNMLKISEAYLQYQKAKINNNLTDVILQIFDSMTEYINNSYKIDYNYDILNELRVITKANTI